MVSAPQFDDSPRRSLKVTLSFLAGALLLVAATALLTTQLTGQAVDQRVHDELQRMVGLLSGRGFPLSDAALERVSTLIDADVVAVDADGHVLATNLDARRRAAFERARAEGAVPGVERDALVGKGEFAGRRVTLGVAPVAERGGAVYVLYDEDLLTAQTRQAWVPVTGVAVFSLVLAVLLGIWSERSFQRARTAALLRLLTSVGHEVRNPLGAIRTLAHSLKSQHTGDPKPLDLIAAEAERLTLLVDGLRVVGLPVRTLQRDVDPDEAVDAVLALLEHQLEHRRVQVDREHGESAQVSADPAHVRQVVMNLVLNAADAMPAGGSVRVHSRCEAGRWVLVVEDTGPGVDDAVQGRLFEAFFTTKAKGLGVGLYMSRRLAEANGGTLHLDAAYRSGARFVLAWPASQHRSASVGS